MPSRGRWSWDSFRLGAGIKLWHQDTHLEGYQPGIKPRDVYHPWWKKTNVQGGRKGNGERDSHQVAKTPREKNVFFSYYHDQFLNTKT